MILDRSNQKQGRRAGFTLLEMVVVMWALGMALALGTALIVTAQRAAVMGEVASERLTSRAELARQFRDDVSGAEAAPEKLGDVLAGPTCLILRMPGGSTVVYRREADALDRVERIGGREAVRRIPLGRADTRTEFVRPGGGSGVVTLRVTEPREHGPGRVSELSAALGGNLR
ncbi:MAG: hypothetical protein JWO38_3975 [Gemmataceae bacterium]|nr:hypothetical protein [Gemmataceae bacterium]